MTIAVIVSVEAEEQIKAIDSWWRENRPAAPKLFVQDPSGAFPGFPAGRRCVVAVGRDHSLEDNGSQSFDAMWATLIDVRGSGSP